MDKPAHDLNNPDQPKLKAARAEIEAVFKKYDLAGVAVLHTPGMSEFFYNISPSYSCIWIDEKLSLLRVRSKAADYGGNKSWQQHYQACTSNMMACITEVMVAALPMFIDISNTLNKTFHTEHGELKNVPFEGED